MTERTRGGPPEHGRFRKGRSGNPKGRPRKAAGAARTSAFDIIVDRTLTITRNGIPQEVGVEEALQHKTYQEAIAGNRPARREVLKMIAKREQALAAKAPARSGPQVIHRTETEPDNANEAMLILGIATKDPRDDGPKDEHDCLLLEPWAVQAALRRRRGGTALTEKEVAEIKRCTRDPDTLRWPRGTRG